MEFTDFIKLNPNKQLDLVLEIIDNESEIVITLKGIMNKLKWNEEDLKNIKHIKAILNKLEKDGFLIPIPVNDKKFITTSFEGIVFIKNGGYTEQKRKEMTLKALQSIQTWAIAIGTSLAGAYALCQFYQWYNSFFSFRH
ncbi:MAG: hypothetical protein ACYDCN_02745 [Bacteroidia bacterium]